MNNTNQRQQASLFANPTVVLPQNQQLEAQSLAAALQTIQANQQLREHLARQQLPNDLAHPFAVASPFATSRPNEAAKTLFQSQLQSLSAGSQVSNLASVNACGPTGLSLPLTLPAQAGVPMASSQSQQASLSSQIQNYLASVQKSQFSGAVPLKHSLAQPHSTLLQKLNCRTAQAPSSGSISEQVKTLLATLRAQQGPQSESQQSSRAEGFQPYSKTDGRTENVIGIAELLKKTGIPQDTSSTLIKPDQFQFTKTMQLSGQSQPTLTAGAPPTLAISQDSSASQNILASLEPKFSLKQAVLNIEQDDASMKASEEVQKKLELLTEAAPLISRLQELLPALTKLTQGQVPVAEVPAVVLETAPTRSTEEQIDTTTCDKGATSQDEAMVVETPSDYVKHFDGIPDEWHDVIQMESKDNKRVKLYFRCKYEGCSATFSKSCNLRDHFRKHTFQRPFRCELCDKSFTQSGNLGRHYKNLHGVNRDIKTLTQKQPFRITKVNKVGKRKALKSKSDTESTHEELRELLV